MARSRNIKPGFFKNEELAECNPLARLLFAGLWTIADREGRMEYRPKRIKAELLPYDDCDIVALLNELCRHGFIIHYEVDQLQYIDIPTFPDHQNPHKNENESTIPAVDSEGAKIIQVSYNSSTSMVQAPEQHHCTPADSLNPITDSFNPINIKRTRSKTKKNSTEGKTQYAEFVWLAEKEYTKLLSEHGEIATKRMIEILDNYKGASGKAYKSDYRAILNWVVNRYGEEQQKGGASGAKPIPQNASKQRNKADYSEYDK